MKCFHFVCDVLCPETCLSERTLPVSWPSDNSAHKHTNDCFVPGFASCLIVCLCALEHVSCILLTLPEPCFWVLALLVNPYWEFSSWEFSNCTWVWECYKQTVKTWNDKTKYYTMKYLTKIRVKRESKMSVCLLEQSVTANASRYIQTLKCRVRLPQGMCQRHLTTPKCSPSFSSSSPNLVLGLSLLVLLLLWVIWQSVNRCTGPGRVQAAAKTWPASQHAW